MRKLLIFGYMISIFGSAQAIGIEKYAGEFLTIGVGTRGLGMGGAQVAVSHDVTAAYWNPGSLALVNYPQLAAMHSQQFGGLVNYDYLGFAMPYKKSNSIGLSVVRLATDDIPYTALPRPNLPIDATYTDESGNVVYNRPFVLKNVSWNEYAFFLTFAHRTSETLSYGGNIKMIHKGDGVNTAWGVGFDIGLLWNPVADLLVGVNAQDVSTTLLAWNTGTRELVAPTLKTGVGYPFYFSSLNTRLVFAGDVDVRFEGRDYAAQASLGQMSFDLHLGSEIVIRDIVSLRIGNDYGHFTAGAGIKLPRLELGYAFFKHDYLDATHRVSLQLSLEEERFSRSQ